MPKGVPARGYRLTKNSSAEFSQRIVHINDKAESDEEIETRLNERFTILHKLTKACISGTARSLIVSGPAGLGKSYTVESTLEQNQSKEQYTIVKGYVRPTGLYRLLFQHKDFNQCLVFDDADAIFYDDTSLNLLKAVCDTTEKRTVSYMTERVMIDDDQAIQIPKSFEFRGSIIFISNIDFDAQIERGHKLAPHLQALLSRSHYIDLTMKTSRDYMIRIGQVIRQGLLHNMGLSGMEQHEVIEFVKKNKDNLRELSLRIVLKIAAMRKSETHDWEKMARITCCKNN